MNSIFFFIFLNSETLCWKYSREIEMVLQNVENFEAEAAVIDDIGLRWSVENDNGHFLCWNNRFNATFLANLITLPRYEVSLFNNR